MKISRAVWLLSAAVFAMPAVAQAAPAAADAATDKAQPAAGDIVVTANRVETLASKTPVTLTAVSGRGLINAGVTNPTTLSEMVPNLSIDRVGGLQITIRGVTSTDGTEKGDPSAAFMIDGIYIARPQAQEVSFYDLARVEVLRGPQGTLFGRNTTAGVVNVITSKPKLGVTEGSIDAAYGNYDTRQATGVINLPVNKAVAVRLAANYDYRNNFIHAGTGVTSPLNPGKDNVSVRGSALVDLGRGQFVLTGDYSTMKGSTVGSVMLSEFFTNPNITGVDPAYIAGGKSANTLLSLNVPLWLTGPSAHDSTLPVNSSTALRAHDSTWGIKADLGYDLGAVTLNYLGAYRGFNRYEPGAVVAGGALAAPALNTGDYWQTSHELRFSTNGNGPLKAQAGAYYFYERSHTTTFGYGLISSTPGIPGYIFGYPEGPTFAQSYAFFGQATYSLTDSLRLTGGVRYSHDHKSRTGVEQVCGDTACDGPYDSLTPGYANRSFAKTTWRAGLDYDVNQSTLLYGVVSTGYKAGGFNDGCQTGTGAGCALTASQLYYEPETLTAYEAGLKTRFADNVVRLNLAAFHYDYSNIQLSQAVSGGGGLTLLTTNAGRAKVDGVEAEGAIVPAKDSRFDFSLAWLNARYTSFVPSPGDDWAGRKLDRSPNVVFTAGYTQTFQLPNSGNIQAGVHVRVSDGYVLAALNTLNQFHVPGYSKTDATLTYNAPGQRWYIQGFIKNIENTVVVTQAYSGFFASLATADPRTFGARIGAKF